MWTWIVSDQRLQTCITVSWFTRSITEAESQEKMDQSRSKKKFIIKDRKNENEQIKISRNNMIAWWSMSAKGIRQLRSAELKNCNAITRPKRILTLLTKLISADTLEIVSAIIIIIKERKKLGKRKEKKRIKEEK